MTEPTADIGLIGLAVMGQNLVLNMDDHGYIVAVFNRTTERVDEFLAGPAAGTRVIGTRTLEELVAALRRPRRVMLMVRAGDPVDATIEALTPLLEPGDVIIDGGNSRFTDTIRRSREAAERGLLFVGTGVSGGEEGARNGPSIMPGGTPEAWPLVRDVFRSIAAEVDGDPCCDWVGSDGAGHYVKMVHNGIEYADMQLIAEAYHLMRTGLRMPPDEVAAVFAAWDRGKLDSYLIEITAQIVAYRDEDGEPLLDRILDAAGQKGTGKWTVMSSMDLGMPVSLVAEAVYARTLSALKDDRVEASEILNGPGIDLPGPVEALPRLRGAGDDMVGAIHDALYAAKIVAYSQGFMLLGAAADEHGWDLDFASIAGMWRGGCIIRSRFLGDIAEAFAADPPPPNLLLAPYFETEVENAQAGLRRTVAAAVEAGIPVPAYSAALAFYDGYRSAVLPANLIQAQRDYFGAHTYERVDAPRGTFFHTDWTGEGGDTAAGSYNA
jgi:6-phosphogluconate dehydrogenase